MFVYVSPGSSFKKSKGGGRGLDFAKIQVAFQFIFNFNWKSNTGKGEKICHVFFTKSIHWGEEGHCQPNFKKQLFYWHVYFFLTKFLCLHFFLTSKFLHMAVIFMSQCPLLPSLCIFQEISTQNQDSK